MSISQKQEYDQDTVDAFWKKVKRNIIIKKILWYGYFIYMIIFVLILAHLFKSIGIIVDGDGKFLFISDEGAILFYGTIFLFFIVYCALVTYYDLKIIFLKCPLCNRWFVVSGKLILKNIKHKRCGLEYKEK